MDKMRMFVDTHDQAKGTFPEGLSEAEFSQFFVTFEEACRQEGVVILSANVGLAEGRAFCMTLAPSEDAVRRAHECVGLPYDSITEVETATPGSLFFRPQAA
ncbi:nickel-binding protein [Oricola sp.]|uniref:nickel-binding protein n=1 Tax=Oricola sp. TaxID=1979950 RepID=UPI0025DF4D96|nr:nickel-binding protein [Oricola sp.]MCI5076691.1 DUF4242 domain-containing protein [Oricola sp.]